MADNDTDLMAEFQEFLTQKREAERANAQAEDDEIEIWNPDGSGARGRRSGFADWLTEHGFSAKPEPATDNSGDIGDGGSASKTKGRRSSAQSGSNATGTQSVARKYFAGKPPAGK